MQRGRECWNKKARDRLRRAACLGKLVMMSLMLCQGNNSTKSLNREEEINLFMSVNFSLQGIHTGLMVV